MSSKVQSLAPQGPALVLVTLLRDVVAPAALRSLAVAAALAAAAALSVVLVSAAARSAAACEEPETEGTLGTLEGWAAGDPGTTIALRLARVSYEVDVAGSVADALVQQEFVNDSAQVLEAAYVFPLPPDAAVHAFELEVGERILEGAVREKGEARQEFETARTEGRRAALLEEHRPNVFTTRVTNVPPGERVVVRLSFAMVVPFDDGLFRLRLPLTVAHRHEPSDARTSAPVPATEVGEGDVLQRAVSVDVALDTQVPLRRLTSPTHEIFAEGDGRATHAALAREDERANRDFVLEWALGGEASTGAGAYVSPEDAAWRDVLVLITPPATLAEDSARAKEVLFVLDTSGSMSDGSLDAAKSALSWCLDRLGPSDLFDVTEYDSTFTRFATEPLPADESAVSSAKEWLRGLPASGGTELLPALDATLRTPPSSSHHRIVIVLTDGLVGNEPEVLSLLERSLGDARLFVLGIGAAPNAHLVAKMASLGRGVSGFLSPGEDVERGVARLYSRISSPLLWDLQLSFGGADVDSLYPERVPDLYAGLPVAVLARVRAEDRLEVGVFGTSADGPASFIVGVSTSDALEHAVVSTLWARARIEHLEDRLRTLESQPAEDGESAEARALEAASVREDLVEHSVRHQVQCSLTSFVVTDTEVVAPGGPAASADAAAAPATWAQTASRRPRALSAGLMLLGFGLVRLAVGAIQLRGVRRA